MDKTQIIAELAESKAVERIIANMLRLPSDSAADLAQIVYEALLRYDDEKIQDLHENEQFAYVIVRIVMNQYYSNRSTYYRDTRKLKRHAVDIGKAYNITDDQ